MIAKNKDGTKSLVWEVMQGWEWEPGSKVRNGDDAQEDGARYEQWARWGAVLDQGWTVKESMGCGMGQARAKGLCNLTEIAARPRDGPAFLLP